MRTLVVAIVFLLNGSSLFSQQPAKKIPTLPRKSAPLATGTIADNVYRNPELGITYKTLVGWVDRTSQARGEPENSSGQVLLAAFERPPEVSGDGINSAIIIAAESLASYPGVKTAADYFDPLTEATTSQGFKVVNEPYEVTVGAKSLVRSDFSKETGKFTMHQSSLVMLSKGYAVSFTFIGGSEDEVEQLIERLNFTSASVKR